jgi:arylsulfatase A-like enzyme
MGTWFRRSAPAIAAVVGSAMLVAAPLACSRAPDVAASARGFDLLVTLIDAASARRIASFAGERVTTPFLDSLAASGTRFTAASSSAPYTLASVASLFLGEHVDVHQVIHAGDVLPEDFPALAESFRAAGYRTHGVSSNMHVHERFGFARGFDTFTWHDPRVGEVPHHVVPEDLVAEIEGHLASRDARPAFVYAHLMPPHAPYDPPPEFRRLFAPYLEDARAGSVENLLPLSWGGRRVPAAEARAILDLYDASLRYVDGVLARIGARLEREGRLDRTVWVVLSDHGEAFGEHGVWQHSRLVVETMLHVPLVVRAPDGFAGGALSGRSIDEPVSLVDLAPTFVELFGLSPHAYQSGRSLLPLLRGRRDADRPPVVARTAGPAPYTSIRRGSRKAIYHSGMRTWQLFDLAADPLEQRDLARRDADALESLKRELEDWWARWRPWSVGARQRVELTAEERRLLGAVGYVLGDEDEPAPPAPEDR